MKILCKLKKINFTKVILKLACRCAACYGCDGHIGWLKGGVQQCSSRQWALWELPSSPQVRREWTNFFEFLSSRRISMTLDENGWIPSLKDTKSISIRVFSKWRKRSVVEITKRKIFYLFRKGRKRQSENLEIFFVCSIFLLNFAEILNLSMESKIL